MADERLPEEDSPPEDPEADEEAHWLKEREVERDRDRGLAGEPKPELELEED